MRWGMMDGIIRNEGGSGGEWVGGCVVCMYVIMLCRHMYVCMWCMCMYGM